MRSAILIGLFCFGAGWLPASSASALGILLPGSYTLLDHGDGNLGPDYGLRMDSLGELFSVELGGASVTLDWDGGVTATITGELHNNTTFQLWDVSYTLTGVVADGANAGFRATAATGTLTDPSSVVTNLIGKADGTGFVFAFLADGHRIDGDTTTPVGQGWLLPPDSTQDWLVRAEAAPEVATWLLLGSALAALGLRRS